MRSIPAVNVTLAGSNPRARMLCTTQGAKKAVNAQTTIKISVTRLAMAEANFQAVLRLP